MGKEIGFIINFLLLIFFISIFSGAEPEDFARFLSGTLIAVVAAFAIFIFISALVIVTQFLFVYRKTIWYSVKVISRAIYKFLLYVAVFEFYITRFFISRNIIYFYSKRKRKSPENLSRIVVFIKKHYINSHRLAKKRTIISDG